MKITLLTHAKELNRTDNTGILCRDLPDVSLEVVVWQRKSPDEQLLQALASGALLITPKGDGEQQLDVNNCSHFVLLDATWQEARKMYNRSDYLKAARWYAFDDPAPSKYHLRRNQIPGGLCTAECVLTLLQQKAMHHSAAQLQQRFEHYLAD